MHDKRGRLIEMGDYLKVSHYGAEVTSKVGLVIGTTPESDSCNVETASVSAYYGIQVQPNNANETEIVMKADGSFPTDPEPGEPEQDEPSPDEPEEPSS